MKIKYSIIISVLESYEMVRRVLLHYNNIGLSDQWELILMDDGSDPPIQIPEGIDYNLKVIQTNDKRKWTQNLARNKASNIAVGEYLYMTDIDHIITKENIIEVESFKGKRLKFKRQPGMITDDIRLYPTDVVITNKIPPNIFCIRSDIFHKLNGYDQVLCSNGKYSPEDREFNKRYSDLIDKVDSISDSYMYVVVGNSDLFHSLDRI